MSLPSSMYRVIDCACRASTTFEAVSSITDATSSLLSAGLEMILISRQRLRALTMEGAAILDCVTGLPARCMRRNEKRGAARPRADAGGPRTRGRLRGEARGAISLAYGAHVKKISHSHGRLRKAPIPPRPDQTPRAAPDGRRHLRRLRRPHCAQAHPRDLQPGLRQPPAGGLPPG